MRSVVILATNLLVGVAALVWVVARLGTPAVAVLARHPSPGGIVAFLAVVLCGFLAHAARLRMIARGLGPVPSLARFTAIRAAGQTVGSLVPSAKVGGDPLRALLLARAGVPAAAAIASVAVDRALEVGADVPFAIVFATILLRQGVPEVRGAFVSVLVGVAAIVVGLTVAVRRLRSGRGLVTALVKTTRLDRWSLVQGQMSVLADAELDTTRLIEEPWRLARAYGFALLANVAVLVEFAVFLRALDLPHDGTSVVAAIFATGAAHSLPVPGAVGVLEGAETWIFTILGHPPEVGLAIGLAVRVRELAWVLPGLFYLMGRSVVSASSTGLRPQTAPAKNPG